MSLKLSRVFLLLAILLPALSYSNYMISPIKLVFTQDKRVISLNFTNNDRSLKYFQLTLFKVDDTHVKEILNLSKDLLITPIMFQLEAGQTQIIRVAQHKIGPALTGKYKLSIRELIRNNLQGQYHVNFATEFLIPITFEEK